MNKMVKVVIYGAVLASVVLAAIVWFISSGHLSRSSAKAQLTKLFVTAPGTHDVLLQIGTLANACSGVSKDYDTVEKGAEYPMLEAIGYVTVKPIKPHVWRVELTERGKQASSDPYGHKQDVNCDQWQVSMSISKFDHFDITGILEEGKHAKVDVAFTFVVTPFGMDARRVAEKYLFENQKKLYGEKLAQDFIRGELEMFLGDEVARLPASETKYLKRGSIMFNKYDDGWKADVKTAKDEK